MVSDQPKISVKRQKSSRSGFFVVEKSISEPTHFDGRWKCKSNTIFTSVEVPDGTSLDEALSKSLALNLNPGIPCTSREVGDLINRKIPIITYTQELDKKELQWAIGPSTVYNPKNSKLNLTIDTDEGDRILGESEVKDPKFGIDSGKFGHEHSYPDGSRKYYAIERQDTLRVGIGRFRNMLNLADWDSQQPEEYWLLEAFDIYLDEEQWAKCVAVANKIVLQWPGSARGWNRKARAYEASGQIDFACQALLQALPRYPTNPIVLFNLARFSCSLGLLNESEQMIERLFTVLRGQYPRLAPWWSEQVEAAAEFRIIEGRLRKHTEHKRAEHETALQKVGSIGRKLGLWGFNYWKMSF